MRVAVDARTVYAAKRRGTGKNLIDLYRHLAGLKPDWRFVMFHRGAGSDDPFAGVGNVENRRIDIKGDRLGLWLHVRLPLAARRAGADVLHCPANTAPRWPGVPLTVTIHDLIPLDPRFATADSRTWGRNVGRAARKARRILTPSAYSKRQIVETFGVPDDKVIVNPWAPDEGLTKVDDPAELARVRAAYGVPADRPYVLVFGGRDPRKNTAGILQAWSELPETIRRGRHLLVIGMSEGAIGRFREQADRLGIAEGAALHGFAPERDLPALLSGAEALCFASLYEGFGLPVLDAFRCATAVVCGDDTSLPEVAGDAALLVDARESGKIAEALHRLLTDAELRSELAERGRRRVEQFTWTGCAARAAAALESAAGEVSR